MIIKGTFEVFYLSKIGSNDKILTFFRKVQGIRLPDIQRPFLHRKGSQSEPRPPRLQGTPKFN